MRILLEEKTVGHFASLSPEQQQQRHAFRQTLRQRRQALTADQQAEASAAISHQILAYIDAHAIQDVALFLANDGEINLQPLVHQLWQRQCRTALPVLHPVCPGHLLFLNYEASAPMHTNRFGIPEPQLASQRIVPLQQLQLILTPLVGFDQAGHRLGMGGGFYDRTLSGWAQGRHPHLQVAGVAHDCQAVEALPQAAWDVPLPLIFTPTKTWFF